MGQGRHKKGGNKKLPDNIDLYYDDAKQHFVKFEKPFHGDRYLPTAGTGDNVLTLTQERELSPSKPYHIDEVNILPHPYPIDEEAVKMLEGHGHKVCLCGKGIKDVFKLLGGFQVGNIMRHKTNSPDMLDYFKSFMTKIGRKTFKIVSSKAKLALIEMGVSLMGEEYRHIITSLVHMFGAKAIDFIRKYADKGMDYIVEKLKGSVPKAMKGIKGKGRSKMIKVRETCRYCPLLVAEAYEKRKVLPEDFKLMGRGWLDDIANGLLWFGENVVSPFVETVIPGPVGKAIATVPHLGRIVAEHTSPGFRYKSPFEDDEEQGEQRVHMKKADEVKRNPRKAVAIKPLTGRAYKLCGGKKGKKDKEDKKEGARTLKETIGDLIDLSLPVIFSFLEDWFNKKDEPAPVRNVGDFRADLNRREAELLGDIPDRGVLPLDVLYGRPEQPRQPPRQPHRQPPRHPPAQEEERKSSRARPVGRPPARRPSMPALERIKPNKRLTVDEFKRIAGDVEKLMEENKPKSHLDLGNIKKNLDDYEGFLKNKKSQSEEMFKQARETTKAMERQLAELKKKQKKEGGLKFKRAEVRQGRGKVKDFLKKHKKKIAIGATIAGALALGALGAKKGYDSLKQPHIYPIGYAPGEMFLPEHADKFYPGELDLPTDVDPRIVGRGRKAKKGGNAEDNADTNEDFLRDQGKATGRGKIKDFIKKHKKTIGAVAGVAGTLALGALGHKLYKNAHPPKVDYIKWSADDEADSIAGALRSRGEGKQKRGRGRPKKNGDVGLEGETVGLVDRVPNGQKQCQGNNPMPLEKFKRAKITGEYASAKVKNFQNGN